MLHLKTITHYKLTSLTWNLIEKNL
jgi:hypothetical protein